MRPASGESDAYFTISSPTESSPITVTIRVLQPSFESWQSVLAQLPPPIRVDDVVLILLSGAGYAVT